MFKIFKIFVPLKLKKYYWRYQKKRQRAAKKRVKFDKMTPKEAFTYIYKTNYWNGRESISGGGSEPWRTEQVIKELSQIIIDLNVSTILDLPCGDFVWMQNVGLGSVAYIGGDIVEDLIIRNRRQYKYLENVEFRVIDLLNDELPKCELLLIRDCLVHFSNNDIFLALENIKKSGCKYLLTTTFPEQNRNYDIATGEWRAINLEKPPFNFKPPMKYLNEGYNHQKYSDKTLALWLIDDIFQKV